MEFPIELECALDGLLNNEISLPQLDKQAKEISKRYRENSNCGKRLVTEFDEAVAYALSRMPATYEAVSTSANKIFENNKFEINTVLDVGAGTGAGTWALYNILGEKEFSLFEREESMRKIGQTLMKEEVILKKSKWKKFDIIEDDFKNKYDLIVVSYMINELPKNKIEKTLEKLWNATNKILLIIEPGTPNGFLNISTIRQYLLNKNGSIIAPCTHEKECPINKDDWCHFTCRVQRSKIHKKLKNGQSPYEDEKFSYIAFSKNNVKKASNRILRHPIINKGFSEFKICTEDGIKNIKLSKKDGEIYKNSKKKSTGDSLNI